MRVGDHALLKSEEEIGWDDLMCAWDHTLLFESRDDVRDMHAAVGEIPAGTIGVVLECDPNYVRLLTPMGIGWSRVHYWRVIT